MSAEPNVVVVDPLDVNARLRQLGLEQADLADALLAGAAGLANCTGTNHPPIFGGLSFWAEAVKALRDRKLREGWSRSDARNFSTIINADRTVQIAIARGDEWTGRQNAPTGRPSTQHRKGTATQLAVETNQQLSLFDEIPTADPALPDAVLKTYVLLHYRDRGQIRSELSQPTAISDSGYVEEWAERLILSPMDLDPNRIALPDEPPVEPDVLVRRRA